jgi:hypothetical protein
MKMENLKNETDIHEALTDLYLNIKIRNGEEVKK